MKRIVFIIGVLGFIYGHAEACSCAIPLNPGMEYDSRNAVFIGTVIDIQPDSSYLIPLFRVTFLVERAWKGVPGNTVDVYTATSSAACGYYFRHDSTYLVYANSTLPQLITNICTRTKYLSDASEDLAFLNLINSVGSPQDEIQDMLYDIYGYPNPANPTITLRVTLPNSTFIRISLYSISGQYITNLYEGMGGIGYNEITRELSYLPSGVYLVAMKSDVGFAATKISVIR